MRVHCDKCNHYFLPKPKEKKHPKGIEEVYFKCDNCYWKYTISVTNKRARTLIKKMTRKREQARRNNDPVGIATYTYKEEPYTILHNDKDVLIDKSKEQIELDETMTILKYNLVNYGTVNI